MNSIHEFPWNRGALISKQYNEPNYKIITTSANKSQKALVFFSSNGIYYPNTEKEFTNKIIDLDYYDWQNIGKHRLINRHFSKIIYVRDIYKQWYVTGINSRINTQCKLFEFLRNELTGYQITTCGSSSGGYMAALMGALLNAERIIDSSGQFDLSITMGNEPFLDIVSEDSWFSKYISLKEIIKEHLDALYYFYPALNEGDIIQNKHVEALNIKRFAIESSRHSRTIKPVCYPYVLTLPADRLNVLFRKYNGRMISESEFYKDTVSLGNRIIDPTIYNFTRIISYVKKKIRKI